MASEIYSADPSGHVFGSKLWIYARRVTDRPLLEEELGAHFETRSLHVLPIDKPGEPVTICPVAFDVKQLPWAEKQMGAPDAALRDGAYYPLVLATAKDGAFHISFATSKIPTGHSRRSRSR